MTRLEFKNVMNNFGILESGEKGNEVYSHDEHTITFNNDTGKVIICGKRIYGNLFIDNVDRLVEILCDMFELSYITNFDDVREKLRQADPTISPYAWMRADGMNKEVFEKTISRDNSDQHLKELRRVFSDFACAVNPFLLKGVSLDNIDFNNYLKKVSISSNTWNEASGIKRDKCCSISISSVDDGNDRTYYSREVAGFVCQLNCKISADEYLRVFHSFSMEKTGGEVVYIAKSNSWGKPIYDIYYNHTKKMIETDNGGWRDATDEDIMRIRDELLVATRYGLAITTSNINTRGESR